MNLEMARTYLAARDPRMVTRTWTELVERFADHGRDSTQDVAAERLPAARSMGSVARPLSRLPVRISSMS
jgi:hypothetical protein